MANVHYDLFCLAELPSELTVLDRQLLGHICTRFNAKEGKAWPGQEELRRITGSHPNSNSRSITRLKISGFVYEITRPAKGTGSKRGNRGEYAPNLKLIASCVYLTDELSNKSKEVQALYRKLTTEPLIDNPTVLIDNPTDVITYPTSYAKPIEPIEPIKRIEHIYVSKINYERWAVVVGALSESDKRLINPGTNYEDLLDQCESNGIRLTEIRRAVGAINYGNAYKVGGLFNSVLEDLAGRKNVTKSNSAIDYCGGGFCDPVTRTWPEPVEINGRMDNRCPKCNEQLINETKRLNDRPQFDLGALENFGQLPDDL